MAYNGISSSHKDWSAGTRYSVDERQKHDAKLKKPDPQVTHHVCDPIYMKRPENVNPWKQEAD